MGKLAGWLLWSLAALPRPVSQWLGKVIGAGHLGLNTRACQVTRANIALCFSDLDSSAQNRMVHQSLINTGRTLLETPAVWLGKPGRIDTWIAEVSGENLLDARLASNQGLIVILPHLGNWELFNVYFARKGKMTALYQPPRKAYLAGLMAKIRNQFGNEMVATNVKGIARLYRTLRDGGVVTILPDQVPARGVFAPFFGHLALTDRLVHRLIAKTGANTLIATVVRRADGRFQVNFSAPENALSGEDEGASIAALNRCIEKVVRNTPEQYQWEYKRFRERPAGEEKLYRFNKPPSVHQGSTDSVDSS